MVEVVGWVALEVVLNDYSVWVVLAKVVMVFVGKVC